MLKETYYTNGNNRFKNNKYDQNEWSAPIMVDTDEIRAAVEKLTLEGRIIKDIRFVSHAYNLVRERLEDFAYRKLEDLPEEERQNNSDYRNVPLELLYPRYAEIDEPLLIKFEDNDRFEIDAPQEPEFRMSMNCIPWDIEPGCNASNAEAAVIFDTCIGKKIERIEVATYITKKDPMVFVEFSDNKERELVAAIILWLDDGTGIRVEPRFDYVDVTLIDGNKEVIKLPFKQLKSALFNWEDIHDDEELGFESACYTFWFGNKCYHLIDTAFIDFKTESRKHSLHIHNDDIMLFSLAISAVIGEQHDVYKDYELSYDQWNAVLDEADRLMGVATYEELVAYLTELKTSTNGKCDLLYYLNNCGEEFWEKKQLHEKEAADLREWTNLALSPGEKMLVVGI